MGNLKEVLKRPPFLSLIGVTLLTALVAGGFFVHRNYFSKETQTSPTDTKPVTLDPQKEATHLSKVAGTKSAYWMRGMPIIWDEIEKKQGGFDWTVADDAIIGGKDKYFAGDVYHIAMIWPFANWDQDACHHGKKYLATGHLKKGGEDLKMGAPCDMKAYANFLTKVVERYDGDGIDDAAGLEIPIKYWEVMNEPEMQGGGIGGAGEDLKFFVGTSQEYLSILKTSYETIKKVDPEAKVAHAGMAGMQKNFQDFWDPVFAGGGGNYFDIANIHTINTDERREDMYVLKFQRYLEKFGIKDKPIWVTEVQFGELMEGPKDLTSFENTFVRSSIFALAHGADKLFFIENWTTWDDKNAFKPPEERDGKKGPPPKIDLSESSTHQVYLNLVDKINNFEKVEKIEEKYTVGKGDWQGATSQLGQYKFINGDEVVYVLWGEASVPSEISGKIKVTDIYGKSTVIDAKNLSLTDSPVFVELE